MSGISRSSVSSLFLSPEQDTDKGMGLSVWKREIDKDRWLHPLTATVKHQKVERLFVFAACWTGVCGLWKE